MKDEILMRVLFVDDDEDMCTMTAAALRKHGVAIDWCTSVDHALARLLEGDFDAVITDLGLGGKGPSGIELCRILAHRHPSCPVVVLTGDAQARVAAMRAGAKGFVTKPVGMYELVEAVREVLRTAPPAS